MIRTGLATIVVAALGTAVLRWATHGFRAFTAEASRCLAVAEQPVALPRLPLQIQTGATRRLSELEGRIVVATFMYTRCTTMCLVTGARLREIRDRLPDAAVGAEVRFLSLSFDPAHDSPARLRDYARRYGAEAGHWWVARPRDGLEDLLQRLEVVVIEDGSGGFRHNAAFYLIDRHGRVAGIYPPDRPEAVVRAVRARL